jgi:hypothetical protein
VANAPQGDRVQEIIHFPWWWEITIDPEPMNGVDPPPEVVRVEGMVGIHFADAIDVNNRTGAAIPIIERQHGLPVALPDGQFEVDTEIVALSLTGVDSQGRDVLVRLNPNQLSLGRVTVDAQQGEDFLTGNSFFDLFVQADINDPTNGLETLTPVGALRVGMDFTDNNQAPVPQQIRRDDVRDARVLLGAGAGTGPAGPCRCVVGQADRHSRGRA